MKKILLMAMLLTAFLLAFAGCDGEEGTEIQVAPGEESIVEDGTYRTLEIDASMSGTADSPTIIRAADGAAPVIRIAPGKTQNGEADELQMNCGIHMVNVHDIIIEGIRIEGGTHGILYESTPGQGEEPLRNITIRNCRVSGVVGVHGICAYAANDLAPVSNLTVTGCEVSGCQCGDSESLVLNGNVDGFEISDNIIHDNNNIGIDMIGFEGTARHAAGSDFDDPYDVDMVRNGKCLGNEVFNISTEGNPAYLEDGGYDLCADGIYVDGGQNIEIAGNYVHNCDIGIEAATEHSPEDDPIFRVSGINVHDNVIADCRGWCGLCFGGYDRDLGFTEDCAFHNNTLVDNGTQLGVQRSKGNKIYDNLFVGGDSAVEYSEDCRQEDMLNDFGRNVWCPEGGDLPALIPEESMQRQEILDERSQVLDGFASKIDGAGSSFVPEEPVN